MARWRQLYDTHRQETSLISRLILLLMLVMMLLLMVLMLMMVMTIDKM